jgi:hypothetical protein
MQTHRHFAKIHPGGKENIMTLRTFAITAALVYGWDYHV